MRRTLTLGFAILTCAVALWAHHSYGTFYQTDHRVTLKGQVTKVAFADPHVILTIATKTSGTWQAEWTNTNALARQGVTKDSIHTGDILEIDGSPSRDAQSRVVSFLHVVRRPADGWSWVHPDLGVPRIIE